MRRDYLFEFEDFSWYPTEFRNVQTDFLQIVMQWFDVFKHVYPKLFAVINKVGIYQFTDLCSGGGGAVMQLRKHFKKTFDKKFSATLTDLYPNEIAFKAMAKRSNYEISFKTESVDIRKDISTLPAIWTVFNAFHHLSPLNATRLLQKAVKNEKVIAIMEPLDRNIFIVMIQSIFLIIGLFFIIPFTQSFNFKVFLFTYIIPVLPLFIIWDGWVSALRVYGPVTLSRMTVLADSNRSFNWQTGTVKHTFGKAIYLIGAPNK